MYSISHFREGKSHFLEIKTPHGERQLHSFMTWESYREYRAKFIKHLDWRKKEYVWEEI